MALSTAAASALVVAATADEFLSAEESLVEENKSVLSVQPLNNWGYSVSNWKSLIWAYISSDKNYVYSEDFVKRLPPVSVKMANFKLISESLDLMEVEASKIDAKINFRDQVNNHFMNLAQKIYKKLMIANIEKKL